VRQEHVLRRRTTQRQTLILGGDAIQRKSITRNTPPERPFSTSSMSSGLGRASMRAVARERCSRLSLVDEIEEDPLLPIG